VLAQARALVFRPRSHVNEAWGKSALTIYGMDDKIQVAIADILTAHPRLVDERKNRSKGDPFVIGLATLKGFKVVTGEKASGNMAKPLFLMFVARSVSNALAFSICFVSRAGRFDLFNAVDDSRSSPHKYTSSRPARPRRHRLARRSVRAPERRRLVHEVTASLGREPPPAARWL
jgi:hypothetical protein